MSQSDLLVQVLKDLSSRRPHALFFKPKIRMLLILGTGNGEPGTGVWEQVYSGNSLENLKWRSKHKKWLEEEQFGLT